ncbi:unnamed protein product, partial [Chrysoparadoxa australica]
MNVIVYLIRFSGWRFGLAALLSILAGICGSLAMKSINDAIHNPIDDLKYFLVYTGGFIIIFGALSLVSTRLLQVIIQELVKHLTLQISNKLASTPYVQIENRKDSIFTVLTHDIYMISSIVEKTPNFLVAIAVVGGCSVYLMTISAKLTLFIVIMLLIVFGLLMSTNNRLRILANKTRLIYEVYVKKTNKLIYGMRELYQHSEHKNYYIQKVYREILDLKKEYIVKERFAIQISDKLTESSALLGLAVIIAISSLTDQYGQENFAQVFTLSLFIVGPLSNITTFIKNLKPFNASLDQIETLGLQLDQIEKDPQINTVKNPLSVPVKINHVEFTYPNNSEHPNSSFKVGPISMDVKSGSITFITGGNGSGKTTFGKVLTGIYSPDKGEISCDQNLINLNTSQHYRDLFSVIWNDNQIFDDIGYTNWKNQPHKELIDEMDLSKVTKIENGVYSSTSLSSGQMKRLALINALLEDRPILFLDEWAANQDIHFKEMFYHKLLPRLKKQGKAIV